MVNRATCVSIGEPLCYRLPYINFVGEIIPAGISGELLDQSQRVGADIGRLTHTRNIARKYDASKRSDPVSLLVQGVAVPPSR